MKCRHVRKYLDTLAVRGADRAVSPEMAGHLQTCPSCAAEYEAAMQTLTSLQPSFKVHASSQLKERIMSEIMTLHVENGRGAAARNWHFNLWKPMVAVSVAAALLAVALLYDWFGPAKTPRAFGLLSQAMAAEEALFAKTGIVHIVNEIAVKPLSDPFLAQARWLPMVSLDAKGKPHFNQLVLAAPPGEGYTAVDQVWYDSGSGHFARLITADGKPVFASGYDGSAIYSLEIKSDGTSRVVATAVAPDFHLPKNPAEFLGTAAGFPSALNEKDQSMVLESGEVTLSDGSVGRVVKVGFPGGPEGASNSYVAFTIRKSDNTIAQMEWVANGESGFVIRRTKTETVEKPEVAWNLANIKSPAAAPRVAAKVGVTPDMVLEDVEVKHMVEKADFETYVFATDPSWAGKRQITDVLDVASPLHRMFMITYRASDGRHVVLVQSYSYNTMLGPKVKTGRLLYQSPRGFKVWSGPVDKWLANILLNSARAVIKDAPSEDRTGCIIETPAGTFPALAVNGKVSDPELHALIDSLVPAKETLKH